LLGLILSFFEAECLIVGLGPEHDLFFVSVRAIGGGLVTFALLS
jgi:hypothetical protein